MSALRAAYVAKKLREQLINSGTGKNVYDALQNERERNKRSFVEFCVKLAFAVAKPGALMGARNVGAFSGKATTNFLKPVGPTTTNIVNPRISVRSAMTKGMRP